MLVFRKGKPSVIDFREMLPASANPEKYKETAHSGLSSIGVPGFLAGMWHAYKTYGSHGLKCCNWNDLIAPTLALASADSVRTSIDNLSMDKLDKFGEEESGRLKFFLKFHDEADPPTENLYKSSKLYHNLVNTLKQISEAKDVGIFYGGEIGEQIVKELNGTITIDDLLSYKVHEVEAISTSIGKYKIFSSPSPSSGPQILASMNVLHELYNQNVGTYSKTTLDLHYLRNISAVSERYM